MEPKQKRAFRILLAFFFVSALGFLTGAVWIHGTSHVTNTTYWVPIGLGLFAAFELGVGVMILRQHRRRLQAT